jgi:phenylalanyl-tRNA synthetase beta chain
MATRLQAAGLRPISPFVDITNYVLIELGHPMHAFDLATLAGSEIRVRRAKPGEAIRTLDGIERKLETDMLVIADARKAQAIAGVMGGAASEVSGTTRTVAFESAYFKPQSVRRTGKRIGLKTEASARFERGTDINAPLVALQRAVALMQQIAAGRLIGPIIDRYPQPHGPKTIHLRRERLALVLGLTVPEAEVGRILTALGLTAASSSEGWDVQIPTFRVDLLREVDLIEEVGRHYGFDKLESTFPAVTAAAPPPDPRIGHDQALRRALTAAGLNEAITFGFIEARAAAPFASDAASTVAVANPLSAKFDTLRPSLLPGLLDAVAHNQRHGRRDVGLFEIGARFSQSEGETHGVGIAWTGPRDEHWSSPTREVDFFDVKGVVEQVGTVMGIRPNFEPTAPPFLVAGQAATILASGTPIGVAGLLAPAIAEGRGAARGEKIFVAELHLDAAWRLSQRADAGVSAPSGGVTPLPRYPFVVRDLSIVVSDRLPAEIIRGTIHRAGHAGPAPLVATSFFDRYKGKGLAEGTVSLSVRLTFQSADRTLTDAEVQQSFDRILAALVAEHQAVQR